jgi:cardiolipin synthase
MLTTVPNALSLARLALAPATVWLILDGRLVAAFWLFLIAAATDALDGILARLLHARTALGSYLDPIADKALLVGSFIGLAWQGSLPVWLTALVVLRDVGLVAGVVVLHLAGRGETAITPSFLSKLNTVMQIVLVMAVMALPGLAIDAGWTVEGLVWGVAVTTTLSAAGYLRETLRRFHGRLGVHA